MPPRSNGIGSSSPLTGGRLLAGGTVILAAVALIALSLDRGNSEYAPQPSFNAAAHRPMPVIDVVVMGEASIAVTNSGGWTTEQVRTYLSTLRNARANGTLAGVGIPPSSTDAGYARGVVYLIDGHPPQDLLGQFVKKEQPGYTLIAPRVRGLYQWPPDRLLVGFPAGAVLD